MRATMILSRERGQHTHSLITPHLIASGESSSSCLCISAVSHHHCLRCVCHGACLCHLICDAQRRPPATLSPCTAIVIMTRLPPPTRLTSARPTSSTSL